MGKVFSRPISPEELKARQDKINAAIEEQRKTENDLITAYLLEKISKLEAKQND